MENSDSTEVEITLEMIEAGVYELKEKAFGQGLADIVRSVYLAMETERRS